MAVPVMVNAAAPPVTQPIANSFLGDFETASAHYILCAEADPGNFPTRIVAYKSTDGDVTWTRFSSTIEITIGWVAPLAVGGVITFGYQDFNDHVLKIAQFTMGADSFGAPIASPITLTLVQSTNIFVAVNSSGDVGLLYDKHDGVNVTVNLLVYSGAVWSGPVSPSIVPTKAYADGLLVNGSDHFAAVWASWASTRLIEYVTIFNGTTEVGTSVALADASKIATTAWDILSQGYYDAASDSIVIPIVQGVIHSIAWHVDLLIGTPSNAPVFPAPTTVYTATDTNTLLEYPTITGNVAGNSFKVYWGSEPLGGGDDLIQSSTASALAGAWSSATTFWNSAVDVPSPPPATDGIFTLSAKRLTSGVDSVLVGLQGPLIDAESFCGVQYAFAVPVSVCWPFTYNISPADAYPQRAGERV